MASNYQGYLGYQGQQDSENFQLGAGSAGGGKFLVVAIDFGTTYSGYAFSFKHDYDADPTRINSNSTWIAGHKNLFSLKTPTCVLLDDKKNFHSFGYQAEDKYTELAIEDEHEDWWFFKRFKMTLHENMKLRRDHMIKDVTGKKELPAKIIFAHGIRYLRGHLIDHLKSKGLEDVADDKSMVHWVLTVPAIWNDGAKQFMREAAEEAGIEKEHLSIALEPEAAALYCQMLPVEKLTSDKCLSVFPVGTCYMVLDLGGGTVDVTVQEVLADGKLKEIHKASGGAWGGTKVDESFLQMLITLVGGPVMSKFKQENTCDDLELSREFETKKRTIDCKCESRVTLRMPIALSDTFEEEYGEPLKSVVGQTNFAGKMTWTGDKVRVDPTVVRELFKLCTESIIKHVEELLEMHECQNVSTILMVGGFSECNLIQEAVKKRFGHKRVIIPDDAGLAVVKGAVLFGHCPEKIVSRKARFTYGVKTTRDFRPGDPPSKKITVDGKKKCSDSFSKHVTINDTIKFGVPLEAQHYYPLYADQKMVSVPIHISTEEHPNYTTDPSCSYLGKITVPLPPGSGKDADIEVQMTFGGTELNVEATEKVSGKKLTATFDFLDH